MGGTGMDPKCKGGSIWMAATLAAVDRGMLIDVALNTSQWASWQVFDKCYDQARLRLMAMSIGMTSSG